MPFANDNGVELWYDINGTGEPLVLTGGFGLLHDQFAKIRSLLTPQLQVIDWHYQGNARSRHRWSRKRLKQGEIYEIIEIKYINGALYVRQSACTKP